MKSILIQKKINETNLGDLAEYVREKPPIKRGLLFPRYIVKWGLDKEAISDLERIRITEALRNVADDYALGSIEPNLALEHSLKYPEFFLEKIGEKRRFFRNIPIMRIPLSIIIDAWLIPKRETSSRKDIENRIKEIGYNFALRNLSRTSHAPLKKKKSYTIYDEMRDKAMRSIGVSFEPDWGAYDRACDQEVYNDGIDPYAGLM